MNIVSTTHNITKNKELLISSIIIILCFLLSIIFPYKNIIQDFTKTFFFLVLIPGLYIKFILNKNLRDYGFNLQNKKSGITWSAISLIFLSLLFYALYHYTSFKDNYHLPQYVLENFWLFLAYELLLVNLFIFMQECFFRGFVIFTLSPIFSWAVILIQAALFFMVPVLAHISYWSVVPFLITSLTGGFIAYKSQSFVYSYFHSLIFIFFLDAVLIYTLK